VCNDDLFIRLPVLKDRKTLRFLIFATDIDKLKEEKDMEKSKPMELGLGELLSNPNIVNNNSFRFISRDLGVIISFAQMDSILFSTGRPYRAKESRIIRILKGEARISINLIEYKVKEPMTLCTNPSVNLPVRWAKSYYREQ